MINTIRQTTKFAKMVSKRFDSSGIIKSIDSDRTRVKDSNTTFLRKTFQYCQTLVCVTFLQIKIDMTESMNMYVTEVPMKTPAVPIVIPKTIETPILIISATIE